MQYCHPPRRPANSAQLDDPEYRLRGIDILAMKLGRRILLDLTKAQEENVGNSTGNPESSSEPLIQQPFVKNRAQRRAEEKEARRMKKRLKKRA